MSGVNDLILLRNGIDDLINELLQADDTGVLSTESILVEAKSRLRPLIDAAEPALIDIALKRLVDTVGRRKAGRPSRERLADLFGNYPNIPQTLVIGGEKRKSIAKLSYSEAVAYLDAHSPKAVSERNEGLRRLIQDLLPFKQSDEDSLEELAARRNSSSANATASAFLWSPSPEGEDQRGLPLRDQTLHP